MRTLQRPLALGLLIPALLLAACSGGDDNGDATAPQAQAPPTPFEAYSEITTRIAEEGSSPELALEAFALVFGPIRRVEPPETAGGEGLPSGTGAVRLVMRHFDELSAAQQEAIDELLIPAELRAEGGEPRIGADPAAAGNDQATGSDVVLASSSSDPGTFAQRAGERIRAALDSELTEHTRRIADELAERMGCPTTARSTSGSTRPRTAGR